METVTTVQVIGAYTLELTFSDGTHKEVDLGPELHGEVFEPLLDVLLFAQATVDPELGTVVWPNGADFSPEFLYGYPPRTESKAKTGVRV